MADLAFPSVEWFQALADITKEDPTYKKFGRLNAVIVFKCGDKHISTNFDVLNIHEIREVDENHRRDADFVIDMEPDVWRGMLDDINQHGHASLDWTLNTLDLRFDEPIHRNELQDGFKADMFFRYNPSLQVFFDNASKLTTKFVAPVA
ncbi:MAG: hypothetical protein EXR66_11075 [Dehalococcoidia bacterium]|nr:hypothetical protein [Dehalococcoidia bacterium]